MICKERVTRWLGPALRLLILIVVVFLVLFIVGRWRRWPAERVALYKDIVAYIDSHALPDTSVAVAESMTRYFQEYQIVALPKNDSASGMLSILQAASPEYVIAWNGIAWDGVRVHPWFLEHYHQILEEVTFYDTTTPLVLFRHVPSPFDDGEFFSLWRTFSANHSTGEADLELRAAQLSHTRLEPGQPLYVTLIWGGDFFAIPDLRRWVIQLVDVNQEQVWASEDFSLYTGWPSELTRVGEDVLSHHILPVSDVLPTGDYHLRLALYLESGEPVYVLEASSAQRVPYVTLASLYCPPDVSFSPLSPDEAVAWHLGEAITLVGYDLPPWISPGMALRVALYWHARLEISDDYKVFVHILDETGQSWVQDDSIPLFWTYPTTQWAAGEYIRDVHMLSLPTDLPRGDYTIAVGMYDVATGVRLPVSDAQAQPVAEDQILLSPLRVR